MSILAAMVPVWVKLAVVGGVALAAFGGYQAWAYHERAIGAANLEAANAKAVVAQQARDAKLSTALLIKLQEEKTALEKIAAAAGAKIDLQPVEPGSAAEQAAAQAVRCMLDETLCF